MTRALRWLLCLTLAIAMPGCRRGLPAPTSGEASRGKDLSRLVDLTVVRTHPLTTRVEVIGMLEAEGQTEIAAGVAGIVDEVYFREGDEVQAGTLLATIDQPRFAADEETARNNAERSRAALDTAKQNFDRMQRAALTVSEDEREKSRGALRVAEAEFRTSLSMLERAQQNLRRSRVVAPYTARINKRYITQGAYLEERTPIASVADLSRLRLTGMVPESAAPIVREILASQEDRVMLANVGLGFSPLENPWSQLTNAFLVGIGLTPSGFDPEFELLASPGSVFHGRIFFLSTVATSDTHMFECKSEVLGWRHDVEKSPVKVASGTPSQTNDAETLLKSTIPPPPRMPSARPVEVGFKPGKAMSQLPQFLPGNTARIRFPLRNNNTSLVIPEEAVRNSEKGAIVFVPVAQTRDDGKKSWVAKTRVLELGLRGEGMIEVLRGLAPGEWIVHRGAEALEDGTPVRFDKTPPSPRATP